jgi:hypothetical protein
MLVCIACNEVLLAHQGDEGFNGEWSEPVRIYPPEETVYVPVQIPQGIRDSLQEANRNLRAESYRSCAVMCRRAIEGLCRHYQIRASLSTGLIELKNRGIIDEVFFQWAESLRQQGNRGAHADQEIISQEDAVDLFDFAVAICQYVFVLGEKFRRFRERTGPRSQGTSSIQ